MKLPSTIIQKSVHIMKKIIVTVKRYLQKFK